MSNVQQKAARRQAQTGRAYLDKLPAVHASRTKPKGGPTQVQIPIRSRTLVRLGAPVSTDFVPSGLPHVQQRFARSRLKSALRLQENYSLAAERAWSHSQSTSCGLLPQCVPVT